MGNRRMLAGKKIWLDQDLTPIKANVERTELAKVKVAQQEGFVIFLRDGRAVITQNKKSSPL